MPELSEEQQLQMLEMLDKEERFEKELTKAQKMTRGEAALEKLAEGGSFGLSKTKPGMFAQLGAFGLAGAPGVGDKDLSRIAKGNISPDELEELKLRATARSAVAEEKFPVTSALAKGAGGVASGVVTSAPLVAMAPGGLVTRLGIGAVEGAARGSGESPFGVTDPEFREDVLAGGLTGLGAGVLGEAAGVPIRAVGRAVRGAPRPRLPAVKSPEQAAGELITKSADDSSRLTQAALRGEGGARAAKIATDAVEKRALIDRGMANGTIDIVEGAIKKKTLAEKTDIALEEAMRKAGTQAQVQQSIQPSIGVQDVAESAVRSLGNPKVFLADMARKTATGKAAIKSAFQPGPVQGALTAGAAPAVAASIPQAQSAGLSGAQQILGTEAQ